MQWEFVVALILAIPIILFPAAFVWYMNIGGLYRAIQHARKKQAEREAKLKRIAADCKQGEHH